MKSDSMAAQWAESYATLSVVCESSSLFDISKKYNHIRLCKVVGTHSGVSCEMCGVSPALYDKNLEMFVCEDCGDEYN